MKSKVSVREERPQHLRRKLEFANQAVNSKHPVNTKSDEIGRRSGSVEIQEKVLPLKPTPVENPKTQGIFFQKLQFFTLILVSMMFDEDKKLIGYEELLRIFESYRFGAKQLEEELYYQGCKPSLAIIMCLENILDRPDKKNLQEFLLVYKRSHKDYKDWPSTKQIVLGIFSLLLCFIVGMFIY